MKSYQWVSARKPLLPSNDTQEHDIRTDSCRYTERYIYPGGVTYRRSYGGMCCAIDGKSPTIP